MAITKLMHFKDKTGMSGLKRGIEYIFDDNHNGEKCDNYRWIGGNAGSTSQDVFDRFKETKEAFEKPGGRLGYHFVVSFLPGEVDKALAYKITQEFCDEYLGEYEHVHVLHTDKEHLHSHIIFNSVSSSGMKYHYSKGQWAEDIQPIVNRLCAKYGLSTIQLDQRSRLDTEKESPDYVTGHGKKSNISWKMILRDDIDHAIDKAEDYQDFLHILRDDMGYEIHEGISKSKKTMERVGFEGDEMPYFAIKGYGMERARRNYNLGKDYSIENIVYRIDHKDYIRQTRAAVLENHPVQKPINTWIPKDFYKNQAKYAPSQCFYYFKVTCAYKTYYRYIKPYKASWQHKKDLVELEKTIGKIQFVNMNRISNEGELTESVEELEEKLKSLKFTQHQLYSEQTMYGDPDEVEVPELQEKIQNCNAEIRRMNDLLRVAHSIEDDIEECGGHFTYAYEPEFIPEEYNLTYNKEGIEKEEPVKARH